MIMLGHHGWFGFSTGVLLPSTTMILLAPSEFLELLDCCCFDPIWVSCAIIAAVIAVRASSFKPSLSMMMVVVEFLLLLLSISNPSLISRIWYVIMRWRAMWWSSCCWHDNTPSSPRSGSWSPASTTTNFSRFSQISLAWAGVNPRNWTAWTLSRY